MSYTGKVTLVTQDGIGFDLWCERGEIALNEASKVMAFPLPMPGHVWQQVEHNNVVPLHTKEPSK